MIRDAIRLVLLLVLVAFAGEARAWTPFGTVEEITPLQDVGLVTPGGEALYLGHKTSTVYFIGGVYMTDDGYVLGLRSSPKHYVDMPSAALIADFQRRGQLPDPLPPYHIGVGDYLAGYSLWIVLVPLIVGYAYVHYVFVLGRRRRRMRQ